MLVDWDDLLSVLVHERGAALVRYAALLAGESREAEDLVQEALIRTFSRGRGKIRDVAAVEGYVRKAILNAYLDGRRRRRLWDGLHHLLARPEVVTGHDDAAAQRSDVETALARLAPRRRAAIVLRFYDDLTVPEIARRLGVSDGAVKRYLHEGVAALEELLGPVAAVPEEHVVDLTTGRA